MTTTGDFPRATTPKPKVDGELAWAISEWNEDTVGMANPNVLGRGEIESLTRFLTSRGYRKSSDRPSLNVGAILEDLLGRKP